MKAKVLKLEAEYLKKYLPDDNIEGYWFIQFLIFGKDPVLKNAFNPNEIFKSYTTPQGLQNVLGPHEKVEKWYLRKFGITHARSCFNSAIFEK